MFEPLSRGWRAPGLSGPEHPRDPCSYHLGKEPFKGEAQHHTKSSVLYDLPFKAKLIITNGVKTYLPMLYAVHRSPFRQTHPKVL